MAEKRQSVPGLEQEQVSRALLRWLNEYPDKPVGRIEFECLPADAAGLSLSTVTAAYKVSEYISGKYEAQYPFALLYRVLPENSGDRLRAAETLDALGRWAETRADPPPLGRGRRAEGLARSSTACLIAKYPDQSEDYQLLMDLRYTVTP